MKNFKFTKLALVVPILGISLCQQAAANSLPEKIQLNYSNTEYKMKCVEGGIPYWIKFDGEQFIHSEDADFSWGIKYDRKSGATSDFIPQSLRSKVVWTDEERRLYHQNLLTTAFAKIFRGDTVSFARGADIDFVGVDEQVKGPNLTRLVSQSVKFTPKKVIYEGSRIFVDGKIAGKIDTVSELTKEGKLVYPEIANKKYKMSMLVDLQAKLHVNTGFFTSLDGSINVVPEGQEPTLIKMSFTCEIAGTAKIPKGFASLKPLLIQIGAVDASPNDLLFFPKLIPGTKPSKQNDSAIALVIGVDDYELAPNAKYAAKDAVEFRQYAEKNLGVPKQSIFVLDGTNATEREILLTIKKTIRRKIKQNQSDVYIFFAGHGLASDDGQKMYLLPYDGAPELLDDTAILRDRLFSDIASANPRSVTVFLDTCYSGTTRGTDMLIASRPIAIKALKQSVPDNFTVMTAAAGDQTAKPLEEAKHGMFSYFLMKGMEGDADANNDNQITAGELHQYVQSNVVQQSSGSQTPELQGDADRVLVRFQ